MQSTGTSLLKRRILSLAQGLLKATKLKAPLLYNRTVSYVPSNPARGFVLLYTAAHSRAMTDDTQIYVLQALWFVAAIAMATDKAI